MYCIWLSIAGGDSLTHTAWSTGINVEVGSSSQQIPLPANKASCCLLSENFLLYTMRGVSAIQRELWLRKFNCSSKETAFLFSKKFWKILSFFTHPKKFPTFI